MRWARLFLVAGLAIVALSACGGGPARPTPVPPAERTATAESRAATSTVVAEATMRSKPPCLVDADTRQVLREWSNTLWKAGTEIGQNDPSRGLQFYEASTAYGILADCRDDGSLLAASGSPVACSVTADQIERLLNASTKGNIIMFQLAFAGADLEALAPMAALNRLLAERAVELQEACGFRSPSTPGPAATPRPIPDIVEETPSRGGFN